jgi:hypothetical protein
MATTFFTSVGNSADSRAESTGVTRAGAPLARASRLPYSTFSHTSTLPSALVDVHLFPSKTYDR